MRAAGASLKAVEEGINLHAQNRDYGKLKEIAEASGLAAKVGNPNPPCTAVRQIGSVRAEQLLDPSCTSSIFDGQNFGGVSIGRSTRKVQAAWPGAASHAL